MSGLNDRVLSNQDLRTCKAALTFVAVCVWRSMSSLLLAAACWSPIVVRLDGAAGRVPAGSGAGRLVRARS